MRNFIKKIPLMVSIALLAISEILFFFPLPIFLFIIPVVFLLSLVVVYILFQERKKQFWPLMIQFFLFIIIVFSFVLFFVGHSIFYHLFLLGLSVILFFLLKQIYYLFYQPRLSQPHFFQKNSQWFTFIIAFCFLSELYALEIFYQIPIWLLILPCFLSYFWFFYYLNWVQEISLKIVFLPIIYLSLVVVEFYLVLSFLPTTFHINGLILSIFYIIIFNLWFKKAKKYPWLTASRPTTLSS